LPSEHALQHRLRTRGSRGRRFGSSTSGRRVWNGSCSASGALDVHKASVTACVRVWAGQVLTEEVAEFKTTVAGLLGLRDWLEALGVREVAMEATGVYWKPVWAVLEDSFALTLVNAGHVKAVPGRKTDVKDAQWLCQLLEAGLLKASFVPPQADLHAQEPDAVSQGSDPGSLARGRAAARDARGRRHQAGDGRDRHHGQVRARHAQRAGLGHDRSGGAR
jgi:hypothetical protein